MRRKSPKTFLRVRFRPRFGRPIVMSDLAASRKVATEVLRLSGIVRMQSEIIGAARERARISDQSDLRDPRLRTTAEVRREKYGVARPLCPNPRPHRADPQHR